MVPAALWRARRLRWLVVGAVAVAGAAAAASAVALQPSEAPARQGLAAVPEAARPAVSAALGADDDRYRVAAQGRLAGNPANRFQVRFGDRGPTVVSGDETIGFALAGFGRAGAVAAVAPPVVATSANRVEYRRPALTEWYVNGPFGLEQGFTIARAPAGTRGSLLVDLRLTGTLAAAGRLSGGSVSFGPLGYGGLVVRDAGGRVLPARLGLRGSRLTISSSDAGALYPLTIDPVVQLAKLTASGGGANDALGYSVAVSGDTLVAGASGATVGGHFSQGAVYVFVKPGGGWADATQTAVLTASDGAASNLLGSSVAVSGDTVVAGAPGVNVLGQSARGAVYVFAKPGGGWADGTQIAKLTTSEVFTPSALLGSSVAASGDTIVAGAYGTNVSGHISQGAVYVFVKPGGGWADATQTAKLTGSDGARDDWFGYSVAVSGDTVAAGAPYATRSGHTEQGAVYAFVKPGGGWANATETARLTASDSAADDNLGYSVGVSGDTVAAGAPGASPGGHSQQGAVYVFVRPGGGWVTATQTAKLTASDGASGYELGYSVAVSGDTVAAGHPYVDVSGHVSQGAVYAFVKPGGGWASATETARLTASDGAANDFLGQAVAASGDTLVGGSRRTSNGVLPVGLRGAAYVFPNPGATPGPSPAAVPADASLPSRAGYCAAPGNGNPFTGVKYAPGTFLNLHLGQPVSDAFYSGATLASFVEGRGLTCDLPPAGYAKQGKAPATLSVPAGVYDYWAR